MTTALSMQQLTTSNTENYDQYDELIDKKKKDEKKAKFEIELFGME